MRRRRTVTKRIELAAATMCSFCFEPIPAKAWAYLEDDCRVECAACHAEAERVKAVREQQAKRATLPQQDLFGGKG